MIPPTSLCLCVLFDEAVRRYVYTASVVGGWSNGGMVLTGGTEVLGEKHYTAWVVDGWMSMEQWWNGTDRGN